MQYEKCSPTAIPAVREHFAYFLYELVGCFIILIVDGMHLRHQFVFLQSSACTECFQGIIVIPELSIHITQQNHWIFGYHLVSVLYRNNEFPILNIQYQSITCMNISGQNLSRRKSLYIFLQITFQRTCTIVDIVSLVDDILLGCLRYFQIQLFFLQPLFQLLKQQVYNPENL